MVSVMHYFCGLEASSWQKRGQKHGDLSPFIMFTSNRSHSVCMTKIDGKYLSVCILHTCNIVTFLDYIYLVASQKTQSCYLVSQHASCIIICASLACASWDLFLKGLQRDVRQVSAIKQVLVLFQLTMFWSVYVKKEITWQNMTHAFLFTVID